MKKILEESIDFSKIGNYKKEDIRFEMKKAVISSETGRLSLESELNFVLPYESVDRFRRSLQGRMPDIKGIDLSISYKDLIQKPEEAIGPYIGHMIALVNGRYAHVTKTIYTDRWELEDDRLTVYALGQMSVDVLNKEVADKFRRLLKRDLDMDLEVRFENNTQEYKSVGRKMEKRNAPSTRSTRRSRRPGRAADRKNLRRLPETEALAAVFLQRARQAMAASRSEAGGVMSMCL